MISLTDLRVRNVTPSWQEAVAVVQELLTTVRSTSGSADHVPGAEHVRLLAGGEVRVLAGSVRADDPVRRAAGVLSLLIDGAAVPGELQALIDANLAPQPQFASVDAFSDALAFFERPNRRADIETLVARVMESAAVGNEADELQRLRTRVAALADAQPTPSSEEPAHGRGRGLWVAAVAATFVFLLVFVGALLFGPSRLPETATASTPADGASGTGDTGGPGVTTGGKADSSVLARARERLAAVVQAARESLGSEPKTEPEPAAEAVHPAAAPRPRARAAHAGGTPVPPPPPPTPRPEVGAVVSEPLLELVPEPATAASTVERINAVYSQRDEDVLPPYLLRPTMASVEAQSARSTSQRPATLDLLIDEEGNVERVSVTPQATSYHEWIYLTHAKAWKFQPATKQGEAVRYRLLLQVRM